MPTTTTVEPPPHTPSPTGHHSQGNHSQPSAAKADSTGKEALEGIGIAAAVLVACAVLLYGVKTLRERHLRHRRGHVEATPLLAAGGINGSASTMGGGPPTGALAGLKGCKVLLTLRRDFSRGIEVLVVDRYLKGQSGLSSRHRMSAGDTLGPVLPGLDRVVVKRVLCETGRERVRAIQEYSLLQRVAAKTRGVVHPIDITLTELTTKDGRLDELRQVRLEDAAATLVADTAAATYSQRRLENPYCVSIALVYYPEGDLQQYVRAFTDAHRVIPESTVYAIAYQVAAVLAVMHHKLKPAVVHADLKPSNLILDVSHHAKRRDADDDSVRELPEMPGQQEGVFPFARVLLADFGSAREMTRNARCGAATTQRYAAPECFEHDVPLTPAVDMWALGVTLLHLTLGCAPSRDLGIATLEHHDALAAAAASTASPADDDNGQGAAAADGFDTARSTVSQAATPRDPSSVANSAIAAELDAVSQRGYSSALRAAVAALLHPRPDCRPNALSFRDAMLAAIPRGRDVAFQICRPPTAGLTSVNSERKVGGPPSTLSEDEQPPGSARGVSMTSTGREMT